MDHLTALAHVLNAAMEHCPPETRAILAAAGQPHLTALEAQLTEKPADKPAASPDA
jgi:hypothetical protein